ncbi:pyridoxamine 5'-phosphate oxidase-related FMN-binding [Methylobacterium sp. 4-46]|uniref:pyridoxamine 5'-phosphate oxidase family protein n=1 Tax=unclassified Methylobacterium TaxID=2615210 RepID=UPI000152E4EE|nr:MULTISPECIES: pyridoxamine 5'-phosphate oxidase family protein [Methylobacterium]ACA20155.1 pyridoxamine 5'-phosphate oxidase-related FMN-binding [Methylobacterium sp. 4-46]WFT79334.1 pyridoxamine 5'-phosphate oxidase family protein [Methylobacterium nodulans]
MTEQPPFYDDLSACLAEAWRRLAEGAANRRGAFHTPTVATVGLDGAPRLRTVVLRGADPAGRRLRFHTDRRAAKVAEIAREPRVALHAYEPTAKIQLRLDGLAAVHAEGPVVEGAWEAALPMSRVCYGIAPGPGTPIPRADAYALPPDEEAARGDRANFRVVLVTVARMEFLYLSAEGHRRARFSWEGDAMTATWLAP